MLARTMINRLQAADFSNGDVDWEQLLRLNYCILLDTGRNFVDIGGNLGSHSTCFIEDMRAENVAIFEPIPELASKLQDRFGGKPGVTIYNCALYDSKQSTTFYVKLNALAESGLARKSQYADGAFDDLRPIDVEAYPLDDITLGFVPDCIKVDIEGAEINMLRGANSTINAARPIISIEYGHIGYSAFGHDVDALPEWAKANKYDIYDLFGNKFESGEFLECVNRYYWDYMLIPSEKKEMLEDRVSIVKRLALPVPLSKWRKTNTDIINRL